MTPSPILKVLSTIRRNGVRSLLMGGQACVLYGGAQFSRDTDILVVADPANLARLQAAVDDLQAGVIAVPPFEGRFLQAGHAVHFRCQIPDAAGIRLDVMAKLRGLPDFETLWNRRTTIETRQGPCSSMRLLEANQSSWRRCEPRRKQNATLIAGIGRCSSGNWSNSAATVERIGRSTALPRAIRWCLAAVDRSWGLPGRDGGVRRQSVGR